MVYLFIPSMRDLLRKKFKSLLSEKVDLLIPPSIGIDKKSLTCPPIKSSDYPTDDSGCNRHN